MHFLHALVTLLSIMHAEKPDLASYEGVALAFCKGPIQDLVIVLSRELVLEHTDWQWDLDRVLDASVGYRPNWPLAGHFERDETCDPPKQAQRPPAVPSSLTPEAVRKIFEGLVSPLPDGYKVRVSDAAASDDGSLVAQLSEISDWTPGRGTAWDLPASRVWDVHLARRVDGKWRLSEDSAMNLDPIEASNLFDRALGRPLSAEWDTEDET